MARLLVLPLLLVALGAAAEAPLEVAAPKAARARIVSDAATYEGVPYLFGGEDRAGLDCSGLVYRSYLEATGLAVPRTARSLYDFAEPVGRDKLEPGDLVFFDTTGPLAHVGIYVGEGRFIHAASEGPVTGVMESSLDEPYWRRTYAGAGRLIEPAAYLGLRLELAAGPSLGFGPFLRGLSLSAGLSYPLLGTRLGLYLRPEYDGSFGVLRLPAVLGLSLGRNLLAFAGPALVLGEASEEVDGARRSYEAGTWPIATAGLVWTPLRFRLAGQDCGFYAEFSWENYAPAAGSPGDTLADAAAVFRLGAGLSLRLDY